MSQLSQPYNIQPAELTWTDSTGLPQSFAFDLVLAEEWEAGATVTEHPVEQGANITDHVRVELVRCTLSVFATNEPLGVGNNFTSAIQSALPLVAQVWQSNIGLRGLIQGVAGGLGAAVGGTIGNVVGGVAGAAAASLIPPGIAVPTPFVASVWDLLIVEDFVAATIAALLALKDAAQIISVQGSKQTVDTMVIETLSYVRSQDEGTGATITIGLKEIRLVQTQTVTVAIPRAAPPVAKGVQNPASVPNAQADSWLSGIASWAGLGNTPHP